MMGPSQRASATWGDYLPLAVCIGPPKGRGRLPLVSPAVHWTPGRDVEITLSHELSTRGLAGQRLYMLTLAYGRAARSLYVRGGDPHVRRVVAELLATAYGTPALQVLWDDPACPRLGPQIAGPCVPTLVKPAYDRHRSHRG